MCTESLRTRLISLSESLRQDQQLIARLSKLPYQVGSIASEEQDARVELSSGIHQNLREHEEELDILRQEADDHFHTSIRSVVAERHASGAHDDTTEVAAQLAGLAQDLKITHIQFRKAQLTAKRNAEAARRREREILFADLREGIDAPLGSHGRRKGQERLTKDEILLNASNDVTAALRRAHRLMGQELERSQFARQTLESSTRDLNTLSQSYSSLDTLLSSSRSLVSTLIHSQKSDTWYLESAFFVLCFSIAWLVFRRLLYGPGWWLLYLPLNLFWRSSIAAFRLALSFLPSVAASAGSQQRSKVFTLVDSSIQPKRIQSSALRSTTLHQDYQTEMAEPSGQAEAIAGGAARNDAVRRGDAIPEMVEKVLKDTAALSKTAAEDGGTETQLRPRREGEVPNPKKRMWEEPARDSKDPQKDEL